MLQERISLSVLINLVELVLPITKLCRNPSTHTKRLARRQQVTCSPGFTDRILVVVLNPSKRMLKVYLETDLHHFLLINHERPNVSLVATFRTGLLLRCLLC